eukprot:4701127-Amphidinium_carterae.1
MLLWLFMFSNLAIQKWLVLVGPRILNVSSHNVSLAACVLPCLLACFAVVVSGVKQPGSSYRAF